MLPRLTVACLIAVAAWTVPAWAQDAAGVEACRDVAAGAGTPPETAIAFCDAFADLAARTAAAEERAAAAQEQLAELEPWVAPPGAILLVDDVRGCPDGWTDVATNEPETFAGRFPVAAGVGIPDEVPLHRGIGGTAQLQLDRANLPPHTHDLPLSFVRVPGMEPPRGGAGLTAGTARDQVAVSTRMGRERTASTGNAMPLDNRPPFVGLYFCRRDG